MTMVRLARLVAVSMIALLVSACTYQTVPQAPTAEELQPPTPRRISGRYLLNVEATGLTRNGAVSGGCGSYSYPVNAGGAFSNAMRTALEGRFERIEVSSASTVAELRRARANGLIMIQPAQFEPRADVDQRGFRSMVRAATAMAANVILDRDDRRAFQGTIEGNGTAEVPTAMIGGCGAVQQAINQATEHAIEQLAERLAQRLAAVPGLGPVVVRRPVRRAPDVAPPATR